MTETNKNDATATATQLCSFDIAALLLSVLCSEQTQDDDPNGTADTGEATTDAMRIDPNAEATSDDSDTDAREMEEISRQLGPNYCDILGAMSVPDISFSPSTPEAVDHPSHPRPAKRKRRQSTTDPYASDPHDADGNTTHKLNRKQRRVLQRATQKQEDGYLARQDNTLLDYVRKHASVLVSSIPLARLPTDSSGYTALNEKAGARREAPLPHPMPTSLRDFLALDFTVLPAKNGSGATCLTDGQDRVFAVREEYTIKGWDEAVQSAHAYIRREWPNVADGGKVWDEHRGVLSYNFGCYHGKGMKTMSWMEGEFRDVVQRLRENPHLRRLAAQVSAALAKWFPRIYAEALRRVQLITKTLGFPRTFPTSVFTSLAVNFGPKATTVKHRDWTDKAGEMCAVQALGHYDHTKGGHLVLWDLKLLIEFPPGSIILFPSAVMSHSNVSIQDGEERTSLVHYTPGNVCRYVDNGFKTETHLKTHNKSKYARIVAAKLTRWKRGLEKLSTLTELRTNAA